VTRYVVADAAAYVLASDEQDDPIAYVARMPEGDIRLLEGSAGLLWHTVVEHPGVGGISADEILAAIAAEAEIPQDAADEVAAGVVAFLQSMVGEGLLATR
jgi:hypothetical protein